MGLKKPLEAAQMFALVQGKSCNQLRHNGSEIQNGYFERKNILKKNMLNGFGTVLKQWLPFLNSIGNWPARISRLAAQAF